MKIHHYRKERKKYEEEMKSNDDDSVLLVDRSTRHYKYSLYLIDWSATAQY